MKFTCQPCAFFGKRRVELRCPRSFELVSLLAQTSDQRGAAAHEPACQEWRPYHEENKEWQGARERLALRLCEVDDEDQENRLGCAEHDRAPVAVRAERICREERSENRHRGVCRLHREERRLQN